MLIASSAGSSVASSSSYNLQQLAAVPGLTTSRQTWNGCIEESDTTTSIDGGTSLTIPSAANDLNINQIPNSDQTRWHPTIPELVYTRTAG